MLIVTSDTIPGWEITATYGEAMGLVVRSRNMFSTAGSGFKSMLGGELKGQTQNLIDSRHQAVERLKEEAQQKGGNAIITMRFDASSDGSQGWTEIAAYGTVVKARPVTEEAKAAARLLGYQV